MEQLLHKFMNLRRWIIRSRIVRNIANQQTFCSLNSSLLLDLKFSENTRIILFIPAF